MPPWKENSTKQLAVSVTFEKGTRRPGDRSQHGGFPIYLVMRPSRHFLVRNPGMTAQRPPALCTAVDLSFWARAPAYPGAFLPSPKPCPRSEKLPSSLQLCPLPSGSFLGVVLAGSRETTNGSRWTGGDSLGPRGPGMQTKDRNRPACLTPPSSG